MKRGRRKRAKRQSRWCIACNEINETVRSPKPEKVLPVMDFVWMTMTKEQREDYDRTLLRLRLAVEPEDSNP